MTDTTEIIVAPWGIEAGPNRDLSITTISEKLRGSINAAEPIKDQNTGKPMVPKDRLDGLGSCPRVPGMQLYVHPAECTWMIRDPLEDDEQMLEELTDWLKQNHKRIVGEKVKGVPRKQGRVDEDTMKTLCREMLNRVDAGEVTVVRGKAPHRSEVDDLPGDYLFNAGASSRWNGPRYEKDVEEYRQKVESFGG